jgi:hypothetical protein
MVSQDSVHTPFSNLSSSEHLPSLLGQFRLTTLVGDLAKENGLPSVSVFLPLARLFTLGLLEFLLDGCGARELLRMDRLCYLTPELQGLVWELLL